MKFNDRKIIKVLVMVMMLTIFSVGSVYALYGGVLESPTPSGGDMAPMINTILGYIVWAGWVIAVGTIITLGIRYMMSSANERADLKNGSIRYIIGVLVLAVSATLSLAILNIFSGAQ